MMNLQWTPDCGDCQSGSWSSGSEKVDLAEEEPGHQTVSEGRRPGDCLSETLET